eukprot:967318-Rhodomonas_salina.3
MHFARERSEVVEECGVDLKRSGPLRERKPPRQWPAACANAAHLMSARKPQKQNSRTGDFAMRRRFVCACKQDDSWKRGERGTGKWEKREKSRADKD